jgi:hypothetical protein
MSVVEILVLLSLVTDPTAGPLESLGRIDDPAVREASGLVQSRQYPGIFWTHNDSGNAPLLFAVRRNGTVVRRYTVGVPNVDWEDIATDDQGHLYLGEIGNNGGRLPWRAIYKLVEPNPTRTNHPEIIPVVAAWHYRFRPEKRFDAEGLFLDRGRAILVAKTGDGSEAELFAVPLDQPAPLLRPTTPQSVGRLPGFTEPATGAGLTADGQLLAVCSGRETRIYRRAKSEHDRWEPAGVPVRYPASDIEAVCWDGTDLIFAGENGNLYRVAASRWRGDARRVPPARSNSDEGSGPGRRRS